jgi:hypothetical protein
MAKLRIDDKAVRALTRPAQGNRIDYDVPAGERDRDFVRGFAVRTTAAGAKTFLLVYVTREGRERRHKIGDFGPHTVTTARNEARRLRMRVDAGEDPFADGKALRVTAQAQRERESATFGGLLTAYVEALKRARKPSADKVESELERTVEKAFPSLWKAPAASVSLDDLVRVVNKLARAGKFRQAEKTRAYLRAAYNAAASARGNAATADLFERFTHIVNVARDMTAIDRPKHDDQRDDDSHQEEAKRALSSAELAAYWKRIKAMPSAHGALLRFHLLTGAQRCEQLARLSARDIDREASTMTLLDTKGRRKRPRKHVVPLVQEAVDALDAMAGEGGVFSFSVDGGAHGAVYHTVRGLVIGVAKKMVECEEVAELFTPGELRISVETRLAAAGVTREVRAQLQSHGLGGVQMKHYDKHDYLDEKRAALVKLRELLNPPRKGKVLKFPAKAG